MKIGTHNGVFHADDVFACAILRLLHPKCEITRTRDVAVLETCDILVDVGGVYDPETGRYDHHQKGGAGTRENGVPYSSFGLVWRHLAHDALPAILPGLKLDPSTAGFGSSQPLIDRIDEELIQAIDAIDCGMATHTPIEGAPRGVSLSATISSLNPCWGEERDFDTAFDEAVVLAQTLLRRFARAALSRLRAVSVVEASLAARTRPEILVLDEFCPWQDALFSAPAAEEVLYVVYRSETGTHMVQYVPDELGSFGKRKALPEKWAGLRDADLAQATDVADAVFCHIGRFIAGAVSKESALKMANLAVDAW